MNTSFRIAMWSSAILVVSIAIAQEAKRTKPSNTSKLLEKMLQTGDIKQMTWSEDPQSTSGSVTADCDAGETPPFVTRILPYKVDKGYIRLEFKSNLDHSSSGSAAVYWLCADPLDGSVQLEARCSVLGIATASCLAAYEIKISALEDFHKEMKTTAGEHKNK